MTHSSVKYLPPRNGLLWLVLALSLSILPMVRELPLWTVAVWLFVGGWRLQIFRGQWQMPSGLIKLLLVSTCSAGLFLTFGKFLALEPMVSLFVCGALLKLLEMKSRKDAQLLLYLCYFLVATQFLFSQGISDLLIGVGCLWLITTALLVIHQPAGHQQPKRSFLLGGRLLLHSLPLMVLLFLIMPRIGSLWHIPLENHGGQTGVSDSMSPGDFSNLSRSGGIAFRATFDEQRPRQEDLYWRGLIFSDFDGRRWRPSTDGPGTDGENWIQWGRETRNSDTAIYSSENEQALGRPVSYEIIMEPTQQPWLYSLMLVTDFQGHEDKKIIQTTNQRLVSDNPIRQRTVYSANSSLDYSVEKNALPEVVRRVNLALPDDFNPIAGNTAEQWRAEAGTDQAYIDRVLAFYNASFMYTLEPPRLGRDTVDEFMWGTQQGFCEHYASSFVVMMRAAGIPARVVVGYLGGEYNRLEDYYVIHQYDAHAWTEVWLSGRGWVRFDPTAAVAPERVRRSLGDLQAGLVESVWSLGRYRNLAFLNELRMQWDALNYRWHRSVMGFDSAQQSEFLDDWLDGVTPLKLVLVVLGGGGGLLLMMMMHLWWQGRPGPLPPAIKAYSRVEKLLVSRGFQRRLGEPLGDFLRRVSDECPSSERVIQRMIGLLDSAIYGSGDFKPEDWRPLISELKKALPSRSILALQSRDKLHNNSA